MVRNLSTLTVLHYVYGGLLCVGGLFMLMFVGMGALLQSDMVQHRHDAPPGFVGGLIQALGWALLVFMEAIGLLVILSGQWISKRRNHTGSLILAGVCCLTGLLGIGLGVFTFVTLLNQDVKREYDRPALSV